MQYWYKPKGDKEVPVHAVFCYVLLFHIDIKCSQHCHWSLTGYSVPLTDMVLNKPRRRTAEHFRKTSVTLGRSGSVRCAGFLTSGIADTMPWENTKEPTPMSILRNIEARGCEKEM